MKMDFKAVIEPLLKKHKLVAFLINDGWLLIRRKEYIDIYIKKQPFSSVEFLFHIATKVKVILKMCNYGITLIFLFQRIVVRVWGRTVIHEQDGDLTKELERVFSTKPCFGNVEYPSHDTSVQFTSIWPHITILEMPVRRIISKNCLLWSEEEYRANENGPAICHPCKSAFSIINTDPFVAEQKVTIEGDINFPSNNENGRHDEEELAQPNNFFTGDDFVDASVKEEEDFLDEKPLSTDGIIKSELNSNEEVKEKFDCKFCKKTFKYEKALEKHQANKHRMNRKKPCAEFKCPICKVPVANRKEKYWSHLRSVHKQDSFECEVDTCNFTCVGTQQLMVVHKMDKHCKDPSAGASMGENHELKECKCEICGQGLTWSQLLLHYKENHALAFHGCQYVCEYCGMAFNSRSGRTGHITKEHATASYTCDDCGKTYKELGSLNMHRANVHMKDSKKRQCQFCGVWLCNPEKLVAHVGRRHTGERRYKCTFCEKSFFAASEAYHHKKNKHPNSYAAYRKRQVWLRENPGKDSSEYRMECHLCSTFSATNIDDLRKHWIEIHPYLTDIPLSTNNSWSSVPQMCDTCGKTLSSATSLKCHTFKKHDLEGKKCPLCSEQFQTREEAMKHLDEIHLKINKEKSAVCQHCGLKGTEPYIRYHMRTIHSRPVVRPKSCTYCQKEFPNYDNMTKHRRIAHAEQWKVDKETLMHEEGSIPKKPEWPSQRQKATCDICGTTLSSRSQLNFHMTARHGTGLPGYKAKVGSTAWHQLQKLSGT